MARHSRSLKINTLFFPVTTVFWGEGWLINNGNWFLILLEAESPRSECWHGWVLVKTVSLVADCWPLIVASHGRDQSANTAFWVSTTMVWRTHFRIIRIISSVPQPWIFDKGANLFKSQFLFRIREKNALTLTYIYKLGLPLRWDRYILQFFSNKIKIKIVF